MRDVYRELQQRVADDDLPPGVGEAVAAAIDGLWLYWVLGLVPVDQGMIVRVRKALEAMLAHSPSSKSAQSSPRTKVKTKVSAAKRSGGRRS
jgi:hypothetical protein